MSSPEITFPGVFVEEVFGGVHSIPGVPTSSVAFVDRFSKGPLEEAIPLQGFSDFEKTFGGLHPLSEASYAIQQFFTNGGSAAWVVRVAADQETDGSECGTGASGDALLGRGGEEKGIYSLRGTGFNVLCLPAAAHLSAPALKTVYDEAARFCNEVRAFLIVDVPPQIDSVKKVVSWLDPKENPDAICRDKNAAVYFPRVTIADPLKKGAPRNVGASGTMAGVYARTDAARGIWKAPAGTEAVLENVTLPIMMTDRENGELNPCGINALRKFHDIGNVCWGARTLEGADHLGSDWKYVPVRRLAIFIEESVDRGTKWAVHEQNDEKLWAEIHRIVGEFMQTLFRSGAFQGSTPKEAYFIRCDRNVITQDDLDQGLLNIEIGLAPLRPAEFVIVRIQQLTRKKSD